MPKKIAVCVCGRSNWRWEVGKGWVCKSCGEVGKIHQPDETNRLA